MNIIFSATIFSVAWSTLVEAEPVEEEEEEEEGHHGLLSRPPNTKPNGHPAKNVKP